MPHCHLVELFDVSSGPALISSLGSTKVALRDSQFRIILL